jgi:hypothetical protein
MSKALLSLVIFAVGTFAFGAVALRTNRPEMKNTRKAGKVLVSAKSNKNRNEPRGMNYQLLAIGVAKREAAAARIEQALQSNGIDVHVTLGGIDKAEIKFKYSRFSRELIYRIQNETELLGNLRNDGFKKAVFTDGHLYTWNYDLSNSLVGNQ